mgnify:CR=1 FL=1
MLDLCAGTGCIGITIKGECPDAEVTLVEKYDEALSFTNKNASYNNLDVKIVKGDVLCTEGADGLYDLIVSNPPYITDADMKTLQPEVKFEPATALEGGEDGLVFYRHITKEYKKHLAAGGVMAFEVGINEAEAVADLIAAQTKAEKDLALSQLRGGISQELATLRERLLTFTSLVELELDFADHEELEFADRCELFALAQEIDNAIGKLVGSFKTGNAIKQGIPVAIIGAPNVGKSTLLNALLGEERAIVSDIQGTTRDTVEDTLVLDGMLFRFIDTAGMRQTDDQIESLGIERSRQAAQKAAVLIHLQDVSNPTDILSELDDISEKKVIQVLNKVDLLGKEAIRREGDEARIYLSAKSGNVEVLKQQLITFAREQYDTRNAVTISNTRHYEALVRAQEATLRVQEGLQMQISGEFLSMDLQDCLAALGEITGQITSQEVLNNIFSKFCIGK